MQFKQSAQSYSYVVVTENMICSCLVVITSKGRRIIVE